MPPRYPPPPPWAHQLHTVGVTGTNGKSTTVTWLWAALQAHRDPAGAITTVESLVGTQRRPAIRGHRGFLEVARAVLDGGGEHLALELTSASLGMGFMAAWPVKVGVFTNLSHDHDEQHGSAEHYLASKAQLFVHLPPGGAAILNGSDPSSALLAEVLPEGVALHTYGAPWRGKSALPCELWLEDPQVDATGSRARLRGAGTDTYGTSIEVQAPGLHFLENGVAALMGAVAAGVPAATAREAIARAPAPAGRFELVADRPRVIVDYAHTPDALRRTLAAARGLAGDGALWLVFGAGGHRSRSKRGPLGEAARAADHILLTSDNPRDEDPAEIIAAVRAGVGEHPGLHVELDRARAIEHAVRLAADDDLVVVAGKGHEREQEGADGRRPFSDVEVALTVIEARR